MDKEAGETLAEPRRIDPGKEILSTAKEKKVNFMLPQDVVVAQETKEESATQIVGVDAMPHDQLGLDIGPKTVQAFSAELTKAKTVVWNGPMRVFEVDKFAAGTMTIAHVLAEITQKGTTTIVGGGDSAAAVAKAGLEGKLSHISTGGGASLEFLEGKTLPGVAALTDKQPALSTD